MSTEIPKFDLNKMTETIVAIKEKIAFHRDELRTAIEEMEDFAGLLDTSVDSLLAVEEHMFDARQEMMAAADTLSEQV